MAQRERERANRLQNRLAISHSRASASLNAKIEWREESQHPILHDWSRQNTMTWLWTNEASWASLFRSVACNNICTGTSNSIKTVAAVVGRSLINYLSSLFHPFLLPHLSISHVIANVSFFFLQSRVNFLIYNPRVTLIMHAWHHKRSQNR